MERQSPWPGLHLEGKYGVTEETDAGVLTGHWKNDYPSINNMIQLYFFYLPYTISLSRLNFYKLL